MEGRLERQLQFLIEIDKAKNVLRQSVLTNKSRRENDAEHSWHLAVMALVLHEYANEPVDLLRVIKMLLIHDLVEIDAGDTFAYDEAGRRDQKEREKAAAQRIFGLLPKDQAEELEALWQEFEERSTADARFAAALDRLHPILLNFYAQGVTWRKHGVSKEQVMARNRHIEEGSTTLWELGKRVIDEAAARGYL